MARALLFDVGDVLMESNWVVVDELERRTGRRFTGRGAMDPAGDPAWQRCLSGEIDVDEYWNQLAQSGGYDDRITFWRAMSVELGAGVFADDALALVDEARAAGIPVGILSNDLYRSATREWVAGRPEFDRVRCLGRLHRVRRAQACTGPVLEGGRGLRPATRGDRVPRRHAVLHRRCACGRNDRRPDRSAGALATVSTSLVGWSVSRRQRPQIKWSPRPKPRIEVRICRRSCRCCIPTS